MVLCVQTLQPFFSVSYSHSSVPDVESPGHEKKSTQRASLSCTHLIIWEEGNKTVNVPAYLVGGFKMLQGHFIFRGS